MYDGYTYKMPWTFSKSDKGVAPAGRLFTKKWKFLTFWGPHSSPLWRLRWNFAQPSGPMWPSVLPSLSWIDATSHPCGRKSWFLACE